MAAILNDDPDAFVAALEARQKEGDDLERDPRLFVYPTKRKSPDKA